MSFLQLHVLVKALISSGISFLIHKNEVKVISLANLFVSNKWNKSCYFILSNVQIKT